ncbi:DUF1996 domain-containing protein [Terrabacter lapilli]|nr:DUF1996 domain-containing protein [Terrabacter sp.]
MHRRRKMLVALLSAPGVVLAMLLPAGPASAMGKVVCDVSGQPTVSVASYDPIVNHNGTGAAHEHQLFGNIAWLSLPNPNTSNYADLVGRTNNCRKVLGLAYSADSAAYWTPTLRYVSGPNAGQLVPAQQFTAYYRAASGDDFGAARAIPADTRLIGTEYNWTCGQNSGARSTPVQSIPDCSGLPGTPGRTLTAHIDFPSCWDGVPPSHPTSQYGDTRDNAHYAYRVGRSCPAGFPIGVAELRETVQFAYAGTGADVALSSDAPMGTSDGRSLHGDFWQTWSQQDFETFLQRCVVDRSAFSSSGCQP